MANTRKKCKHCKNWFDAYTMVKNNKGTYCNSDCMFYDIKNSLSKLINKGDIIREKAVKFRHGIAKKRLRTRTDWYNLLKDEVNKYVRLRDINEPCCTCGTTSQTIKYDAGHCFTTAARPDLRFNLTNIHKQCSVKCNQHGSGMRLEYKEFITSKYGANHFDWLKSYHRPLSEEFPHWTDIEKEIQRYRALNKIINSCK
tara:strand:- start:318 stop:914 length:597 start_codon:yes stop_codon:yes gene_type:complete